MRSILVAIIIVLVFPLLVFGAVGVPADPFAEGIKLFNAGKSDLAVGSLSKAVSAKPGDVARRLTYGVALASVRKYGEAIVQFRESTRLAPDNPVAYFLLEGAYIGNGNAVDARDARRAAETRLAGAGGNMQQVAVLGQLQGAPYDGNRAPAVVAGPSPQAELLERAVTEHPDNAIAHNLLGDFYQVQGRYPEAIAHYRSAAGLAPKWIKPWFNLGMANLRVDPAEAAVDFRKVAELDPKNLQAQLWLGDAYAEQKDYVQAIGAYANAAMSPAIEPQARSRMGNLYMKQNMLDQAAAEFEKASKLAPKDPVSAAGRAEVYQQQRKPESSEKEYQRAISNSNATQQAVVVPKFADVYIERGDYARAISELKRVVALNPSYMEPIRALVGAYRRGGMLKDGIAEYESVLKRDPHDSAAMRFLVTAYAADGNAGQRVIMARKLVKESPNEAAIWNRELGTALAMFGDRQGALDAWRQGLEVDPLLDSAGIVSAAESAGMASDLTAWYVKESAVKSAPAPSLILAGIYERSGDFRGAAEVMKRVAKRFPAKQQYWISLGDDLARCGDKLAAKEAYSHASRAGESLTLRAVATQRMKDIQ